MNFQMYLHKVCVRQLSDARPTAVKHASDSCQTRVRQLSDTNFIENRSKQDSGKCKKRLLLFFNGWGASPDCFQRLQADDDQEVIVLYDYRSTELPIDLSAYREIRLVAWSLGVWVAEQLMPDIPLASAVAINGTGLPVDDRYGIPPAVFDATLENLTEEGRRRFNRRMCGARDILNSYNQFVARPIEEVREELQWLYDHIRQTPLPECRFPWTKALISNNDRIFPTDNLLNYWEDRAAIERLDTPHYPFYLWKHWNELTQ